MYSGGLKLVFHYPANDLNMKQDREMIKPWFKIAPFLSDD